MRIWLTDNKQYYIGETKVAQDSKFSLSKDESQLIISNVSEAEPGQYQCKLAVNQDKQVTEVTHTLRVVTSDTHTSGKSDAIIANSAQCLNSLNVILSVILLSAIQLL